MSEEARAAYQSMSAEERATYMKETMGVPEMIGADGKPIKVGGSGSSRRGGGGDAGGLPAAELEKLSPEDRAKYETMSAAQRAAFAGVVSLEWERLWHPYLPPLEDALEAARTWLV